MMSERGNYIVIEGGADGIGKSTQANLLVDHLNDEGVKATYVHEPGEAPDRASNEVEDIMEFITKSRDVELSPKEAFLAFTIGRLATWRKKIEPQLENGTWVVSDRNWLSSVVYQGYADKLGMNFVRQQTAVFMPQEYMQPRFTVMAFADEEYRQKLLTGRGTADKDDFESRPEQFQQDLREGYNHLDDSFVSFKRKIGGHAVQTAKYVSFEGSIDEVHERVWETISTHVLDKPY